MASLPERGVAEGALPAMVDAAGEAEAPGFGAVNYGAAHLRQRAAAQACAWTTCGSACSAGCQTSE